MELWSSEIEKNPILKINSYRVSIYIWFNKNIPVGLITKMLITWTLFSFSL